LTIVALNADSSSQPVQMANTIDSERGHFSTTHWSLVANAANAAHSLASSAALEELLRRYMPALRAHLVHRLGKRCTEIEDLLQGFIADKVVAENLCHQANREKGRFRNFLLTALDNYVASHFRYVNAKKRRGDQPDVNIDGLAAFDARQHEPDEAFDVVWARQVITEAIEMTERLYASTGRPHVFTLFKQWVLEPAYGGGNPPEMEQVARQLGFESARQASNVLVGAKRNFARMLREVVRAYAPDQDVDDELLDLRTILARHGARRQA
jgi:RNA polymerase sigma-70 factor (ECF subfamily)